MTEIYRGFDILKDANNCWYWVDEKGIVHFAANTGEAMNQIDKHKKELRK